MGKDSSNIRKAIISSACARSKSNGSVEGKELPPTTSNWKRQRMILRLTSKQLRFLRDESRRTHPIEACALLFGRSNYRETVVTKIVVMTNVLESSTRFEAEPQKVFEAFEEADRNGLHFIGFFHSHPAPAKPSGVDLQYMRLWGEAVWLILSTSNGKIAAFQMTDGDLNELTLRVESTPRPET